MGPKLLLPNRLQHGCLQLRAGLTQAFSSTADREFEANSTETWGPNRARKTDPYISLDISGDTAAP